ncbi:lysozyme inhibitor LprI family protein [Sphingomonas sp. Mn802worker]|uniref:lysozyme inhibitor LprI family protein n=1 Tax=Sphingomonas sp. Mn802worker TaxID=629773 RepID=UPI000375E571|nr:lysozyme inhibitor LprI family protein [Sphingomonas sp. Mn802worker]
MTALLAGAAAFADTTAHELTRCVAADPSTAGQLMCEDAARRRYDARMNRVYAALLRRLPAPAAARLRIAQRAWLVFRDADANARSAVYATRIGTMYAPMQAADSTAMVRDRALALEKQLRVLSIDD